jgi:hypothetical protein
LEFAPVLGRLRIDVRLTHWIFFSFCHCWFSLRDVTKLAGALPQRLGKRFMCFCNRRANASCANSDRQCYQPPGLLAWTNSGFSTGGLWISCRHSGRRLFWTGSSETAAPSWCRAVNSVNDPHVGQAYSLAWEKAGRTTAWAMYPKPTTA